MTMPSTPQPAPEGPVSARPRARAATSGPPTPSRRPLPPLPPLPSPHGPASLRSPVALGRATAALLGLVIAADLGGLWADRAVYEATRVLVGGVSDVVVRQRIDHAASLDTLAVRAYGIALVAAVVVYLVWFRRVRVNAEVFSPYGHTMSRAWASWCWFVPLVQLWFPRRIMGEIWDASRPAGARNRHALLNAWWTFWGLRLLTARLSSVAVGGAETAEEIQNAAVRAAIADGVDIVAAALAIVVVLKLTWMQDRKAQADPVAVEG
ncbi:DUF4328 domain-containing protein [Streptomyces sp. NPDC002698]|uniref:DUF4328 domain-containing protein n=1 Tax=Streptomyces sp. NPDC002698 TaxID=3364660 RepID=UPI0036A42F4C